MTRRQPYSHVVAPDAPVGATPETDADDIEIRFEDNDFATGGAIPSAPDDKKASLSLDEPAIELETPRPAKVEPPVTKVSADEEAFNKLKAQLDRERQAREAAERRATQWETDHLSVQERLRQEQERFQAQQLEHLATQELAIDNAIRSVEQQAASAEEAVARCLENADYAGVAKYQRAIAQAEADIKDLKRGKESLDIQKKTGAITREEPKPRQEPPRQQTEWEQVEAYINQQGPKTQRYLRDHYDDIFGEGQARLNELVAGHWMTKAKGIAEGSDQYFDYLDKHMGYRMDEPKSPQPKAELTPPPAPVTRKSAPPAAPVSRGLAVESSTTPTSITLSAAEKRFCDESGVAYKDYARQKLRVINGSKDPSYTGPRFTSDL